jgi:hypothetical protein
MHATPIEARCRRCSADFYLFELIAQRSGRCPRCGHGLTPDWSAALLDSTIRAIGAQRALVGALYRLNDLPGDMVLRPHTVLRSMFEEIGWERELADDPQLLGEELHELRQLLGEWERLAPARTEDTKATPFERARRWFGDRRRALRLPVLGGDRDVLLG